LLHALANIPKLVYSISMVMEKINFNLETFQHDFEFILEKYSNEMNTIDYRNYEEVEDFHSAVKELINSWGENLSHLTVNGLRQSPNKEVLLKIIQQIFLDKGSKLSASQEDDLLSGLEPIFYQKVILNLLKTR
jgi:hypothetical protein